MRARALITFAIIASVALITACSGSPATCPEMGIITSVDEPVSPLNIDNRVGSEAPNFTWQVIDCKSLETTGQTMNLADFQGKPVIVAFHKRHGCPGCQQQTPYVQAVYDKRGDAKLAVVTIYRGDSASQTRDYVASHGYTLPALADANDKVGAKYGFAPGAPITVFVDASGVIGAEKVGPLESQDEIEEILESL
jgi:peroxiredoxin